MLVGSVDNLKYLINMSLLKVRPCAFVAFKFIILLLYDSFLTLPHGYQHWQNESILRVCLFCCSFTSIFFNQCERKESNGFSGKIIWLSALLSNARHSLIWPPGIPASLLCPWVEWRKWWDSISKTGLYQEVSSVLGSLSCFLAPSWKGSQQPRSPQC